MRALLDVNALIALLDEEHSFNPRIRRWWAGWRDGWSTCPLTENGFVRVVSQPGYSSPMPLAQAANVIALAAKHADHRFWPDDISIGDPAVFDHSRVIGPKQLTDVYLLALAVKNGGRLVTFDRAIPVAAVRGATPDHLVVP